MVTNFYLLNRMIIPSIPLVVSENRGFSPQIIHEKQRFSMIFTIHFGGFSPYFWKNTHILDFPCSKGPTTFSVIISRPCDWTKGEEEAEVEPSASLLHGKVVRWSGGRELPTSEEMLGFKVRHTPTHMVKQRMRACANICFKKVYFEKMLWHLSDVIQHCMTRC